MNPTLTLDEQVCECLKVIDRAYDYELCAIVNSFKHERENIMEVVNGKPMHMRKGNYIL